VPNLRLTDGVKITFEVRGERGPFVYLGPHVYLTPSIPGNERLADAFTEALSDRYRVILADWPRGIGESIPARRESLSVTNAVKDVLEIADAAGAEEFAWWGYSFGGALGLQLAARTDRISALVVGGYPPIWQPTSEMLASVYRMLRMQETMSHLVQGLPPIDPEIHRQSIEFYSSIAAQDEYALVESISCPRMVFHDSEDCINLGGLNHDLAERTRASEEELISLGWRVNWIETGLGHFALQNPEKCLPAFVPFLDSVLLPSTVDKVECSK
jgi:pimeloyl-ACP methyl ester carboxylesterase